MRLREVRIKREGERRKDLRQELVDGLRLMLIRKVLNATGGEGVSIERDAGCFGGEILRYFGRFGLKVKENGRVDVVVYESRVEEGEMIFVVGGCVLGAKSIVGRIVEEVGLDVDECLARLERFAEKFVAVIRRE